MGGVFERTMHQGRAIGIAQAHRRQIVEPDVIDVLVLDQALEELDRDARPAGGVTRHLFQHGAGALALPVGERVGDIGAQRALAELAQGTRSDEIAEIGDDPVLAGLDEPIVVERVDVLLDDFQLAGKDLHQGLKGTALVSVEGADMAGQQAVEPVAAAVTHRRPPW